MAGGTGRGWLTGASGLRPAWMVAPVPPPAGEHRVTSRASDTDGNLQPPYAFFEAALCDADIPVTARSAAGPGRLLVDR